MTAPMPSSSFGEPMSQITTLVNEITSTVQLLAENGLPRSPEEEQQVNDQLEEIEECIVQAQQLANQLSTNQQQAVNGTLNAIQQYCISLDDAITAGDQKEIDSYSAKIAAHVARLLEDLRES